jgi:hypothetical protein
VPNANGRDPANPSAPLKSPFISAVSHTGGKTMQLYLPSSNPSDHHGSRNGMWINNITDPNIFD